VTRETAHRHPEPEFAAAAGTVESLARAVDATLAAHGLSPVQWRILRFLDRRENRQSGVAVSGIAAFHGMSIAVASRALKALTQKGLTTHAVNPEDTRSHLFGLTDAGRGRLDTDPITMLENALAMLDEQDRLAFVRGCGRMTLILSQIANDSSDRVFLRSSCENGLKSTASASSAFE
jgi:DNA-binding MarR family transcriptional regulator